MIRFVTGTDTGVGKTIGAAVLAYSARTEGKRVLYVKPVQTGVGPGRPGDADFVRAAADVEAIELRRFTEPLAPAVAAERAGVAVDVDELAEQIRLQAAGFDLVLVEGAGGLLAPLAGDRAMADLAILLGSDLVVAARPSLGTLSHTALTIEAARHRGLGVPGLVVSGWPRTPGVTETTNLERLRQMAPVLAVVRKIRGVSVDGGRFDPLRRALARGTALANPV